MSLRITLVKFEYSIAQTTGQVGQPDSCDRQSNGFSLSDQLRSGEQVWNSSFPANWLQQAARLPPANVISGKPSTNHKSPRWDEQMKGSVEKFELIGHVLEAFDRHGCIEALG